MGRKYDVGSVPDRAPANREKWCLIITIVTLLVVCVGVGVGLGVYFGACTKSCDAKAPVAGGAEGVKGPCITSTEQTTAASTASVPATYTSGLTVPSRNNNSTTGATTSTSTVVQTSASLTSSAPKPPTEGGVYFSPNQLIRMTFGDSEFPAKGLTYFRVGFQTKKKQGILTQIRDASNKDYVSLEMNNNGGVKYFLDVGFMRFELNTGINNIDYADGLPHDVIVRRSDDGRNLTIEITTEGADANRTKADQIATAFGTFPGYAINLTLNNPKVIFIGNNDTGNSRHGFDGCILRMQIDNFYPLRTVFQNPKPTYDVDLHVSSWLQPNTCGCVIKVFNPRSSQDTDKVPQKPPYDAQQIPLKLRPDMLVRYSFNRTLEYYINSFNNLVTVMFVTDVSRGTLVRIDDSDFYASLDINDNGTVTFSFHDGSFEFALTSSDSVNVTDGRIHTLTLFRFSGQTQIALEIDTEANYGMLDCRIQTWLEKTKNYLYIGNTGSNSDGGLDGCISYLAIGNSGYPHDEFKVIDVYSNKMYDKDLMFNDTTHTNYIRSICGMTNLNNSTVLQAR